MSLLGMSLLDDIISKMNTITASEILNILRTRMIQSLHQKTVNDENRDGMNIAIAVQDPQARQIDYAGAYHPLYLVRDGHLIEYKPDRMSISLQCQLDQDFQGNIIQYIAGDMVYLSTDGYSDQISGETNKKMTRRKFKNLLENIAHLNVDEQKEELSIYFERWKGIYEQIDDILVIGFRV